MLLALAVSCSCDPAPDSTVDSGGDSVPVEDTTGPEAIVPDGVTWIEYNDHRLGAALAAGPGAMLVISGPSQGSEMWEDTEEPRVFLMDSASGDMRRDAFATLMGGWPDDDGAPYYATRIGTEVVLPGDVTGDGEPDVLLFTDDRDGDLDEPAYLYPGPHSGEMNIIDPGVLPIAGPDGWNGVHCGDLDANGVDELCMTSGVVFGPVGEAPAPSLTWSESDPATMALDAADLDGDGVDELVIAEAGAGRIMRLSAFEPADVELGAAADATWQAPVGEVPDLRAGDDLDGDGRGDLAVAWSVGSRSVVYVLTAHEGGTLEDAVAAFAVPATTIAVGDFDGDGPLDLALGGHGSVRAYPGPVEPGSYAQRDAVVHLVGVQYPDDSFGHAMLSLRLDDGDRDVLFIGAPDTLETAGGSTHLTGGMVYRVPEGWL